MIYLGTNQDSPLLIDQRHYCAKVFFIVTICTKLYVEKKYFEDAPDISNYVKKGDNVAQITVYSGNRNLLGPHHYGPDPEPDLAAPQMFDFVLRYKGGECDRESKQYSFVKFL